MRRFSGKEFIHKEWRLLVIGIMALLIFLMLLMVPSCGKYKEDCIAEEMIEEIIEQGTGVDVDLTPLSPEGVCK